MFVDFDTTNLFGDKHVKLASDSHRYISTKDPKHISKYINTVHKHLSNNNFWDLSKKLGNADKANHPLAERLDKLLIQACLLGEKKCKDDIRTGGHYHYFKLGLEYTY
jgi:hypothetical protein